MPESADDHPDVDHADAAALTVIKGTRMLTDPIIVHAQGRDHSAHNPSRRVREDIVAARLQQTLATPVNDPITRATWPETCVLLSSWTLVQAPIADLAQMYRWAFRRYLRDLRGLSTTELPASARVDPLPEHLRTELESLRKTIKVDRDTWYLDHRYDPDCGVPKAFWTQYHAGGVHDHDAADYDPAAVPIDD